MKEGETRLYTVPLRRGYMKKPIWKKTNAAVKTLKAFLIRHTKMEPKILRELNEYLWLRGNKRPPTRVKIKTLIKDGFVYANLEDKEIIIEEKEEKKDKTKEEKKKEKEKKKEEKGDKTKDAPAPKIKEKTIRASPQKGIKRRVIPKKE